MIVITGVEARLGVIIVSFVVSPLPEPSIFSLLLIVIFSVYVPRATLIVSPTEAALIAACIESPSSTNKEPSAVYFTGFNEPDL